MGLYKQLFGKDHIRDGDVIDLSEHGRAGGVSTGQGFKVIGFVQETTLVAEDSGDSNVQYIGKTSVGSSADTTSAIWMIKKVDCNSGTVISFAQGNDNYTHIWGNREAISYA